MVAVESKLKQGLPRTTVSLCPECKKKIDADLFIEDGAVKIRKKCDEHGEFRDIMWSDADLYLRAEKWAVDGIGVENPQIEDAPSCPEYCGLCNLHTSHTSLANLDLTNRCNLTCPICFANANAQGYVYEPSYEQVVEMLKVLRNEKPLPCVAVQFSGGEPTIYPRFFDVLRAARDLGFAQIQVATNGIKLANSVEFCMKAVDAGLHTVYLQFDGLKEENYVTARGKPLFRMKRKVIQNIRRLPVEKRPSLVFVPTIVKGLNDDQLGDILRYGIDNRDVVRGVNFQPVSLAGRIPEEERSSMRFTLSDMVHRLEEQTTFLTRDDWYPVPFVVPISQFISTIHNEPKIAFTTHPACGLASYLYVPDTGDPVPITRFVDVEGLMEDLWQLARKAEKARTKLIPQLKAFNALRKRFDEAKAPEGLKATKFLKALGKMFDTGTKEGVSEIAWKWFYVGGMHFMDLYNYDVERVKRCAIHYAAPDGRIIPFCAYNTGPTFREEVEKKFSVPLEEWRKKHGESA
ncbi:MAG: tetraether lipid synthase Tes [Thermoplasmata archaeon]